MIEKELFFIKSEMIILMVKKFHYQKDTVELLLEDNDDSIYGTLDFDVVLKQDFETKILYDRPSTFELKTSMLFLLKEVLTIIIVYYFHIELAVIYNKYNLKKY